MRTPDSLFESAVRRGFWQRLVARLQRQPTHLHDFTIWQANTAVTGRVDCGTMTIPIRHIVGSVGRSQAFDRHFMPLQDTVEMRWQRLMALTMIGVTLPPIEVYETNVGYFVIDGNHRVSIYSFLGIEYIDAHVIRLDVA